MHLFVLAEERPDLSISKCFLYNHFWFLLGKKGLGMEKLMLVLSLLYIDVPLQSYPLISWLPNPLIASQSSSSSNFLHNFTFINTYTWKFSLYLASKTLALLISLYIYFWLLFNNCIYVLFLSNKKYLSKPLSGDITQFNSWDNHLSIWMSWSWFSTFGFILFKFPRPPFSLCFMSLQSYP